MEYRRAREVAVIKKSAITPAKKLLLDIIEEKDKRSEATLQGQVSAIFLYLMIMEEYMDSIAEGRSAEIEDLKDTMMKLFVKDNFIDKSPADIRELWRKHGLIL